MAYVAIADRDHHLHDPQTFIEKYIWSQDHKVIAIQYGSVAIFVGLVALVLSLLMRLADRVPRYVLVHHAVQLLPVRDHARDDHGHLPADGALPRRLRQLPDSAHVRRTRHGVPVHEHAELLGLPAVGDRAARELLRARRPDGRGLDALPAADRARGHARRRLGHRADARLARDLHRRVHDGRPELRDDGAAGALPRHDDDADAAVGLGHLRRDDPRSARVPGAARRRHHDAARSARRHELLHAGAAVARRAVRSQRRQPDLVPASVLVLRPSRGVHRRAARVRHRVGSACARTRARTSSATA